MFAKYCSSECFKAHQNQHKGVCGVINTLYDWHSTAFQKPVDEKKLRSFCGEVVTGILKFLSDSQILSSAQHTDESQNGLMMLSLNLTKDTAMSLKNRWKTKNAFNLADTLTKKAYVELLMAMRHELTFFHITDGDMSIYIAGNLQTGEMIPNPTCVSTRDIDTHAKAKSDLFAKTWNRLNSV